MHNASYMFALTIFPIPMHPMQACIHAASSKGGRGGGAGGYFFLLMGVAYIYIYVYRATQKGVLPNPPISLLRCF